MSNKARAEGRFQPPSEVIKPKEIFPSNEIPLVDPQNFPLVRLTKFRFKARIRQHKKSHNSSLK